MRLVCRFSPRLGKARALARGAEEAGNEGAEQRMSRSGEAARSGTEIQGPYLRSWVEKGDIAEMPC